jgi:hypothetical protein
MATLTRRSVLGGSAALAIAGTLARPYLANAAAATAIGWWVQASPRKRTYLPTHR